MSSTNKFFSLQGHSYLPTVGEDKWCEPQASVSDRNLLRVSFHFSYFCMLDKLWLVKFCTTVVKSRHMFKSMAWWNYWCPAHVPAHVGDLYAHVPSQAVAYFQNSKTQSRQITHENTCPYWQLQNTGWDDSWSSWRCGSCYAFVQKDAVFQTFWSCVTEPWSVWVDTPGLGCYRNVVFISVLLHEIHILLLVFGLQLSWQVTVPGPGISPCLPNPLLLNGVLQTIWCICI